MGGARGRVRPRAGVGERTREIGMRVALGAQGLVVRN
jgi:hypothetical protein